MKQKYAIIIIFLSSAISYAVTIGSDTAVNRFYTQQTLFSGDRVASFAALNGGFSLFGQGTTAVWDSFFPVSGQIALNAGHLILNTDLLLNNISSISTLGKITGQFHTISLCQTSTFIITESNITSNCTVNFLTTLGFGTSVTALAWSFDSRFLAVGIASNLLGSEFYLYSFDGSSFTLEATLELGLNVNAVAWHPSNYNLAIGTASALLANELFVYDVNPDNIPASTLLTSYEYSANINALAYHPSGNYLALGGSNGSRELMLFQVNPGGSLNTGSPINVNLTTRVSNEALSWDPTGAYLAVGTTATGSDNELRVYSFNSGAFSLTLNSSLNLGAVNTVSWHPNYSTILAVGTTTSPRLRWYRHNPGAGSLTQIGTISTNLNGSSVNQVAWGPDGGCLALVQNGSSPGGECIIYSFDSTATTLTEFQSIEIGTTCQVVAWTPNDNYLTFGSNNNNVYVYQRASLSFLDQCFTVSNANILFNNDVILRNCCLNFVENCEIHGQGFLLDMQNTATIAVGSNATLTIKDLIVNGVNLNNIRCVDGTAKLILNNVIFNLADNYNFSSGSFTVIGDFLIRGNNKTFSYLTDQTSVISQYSSLIVDSTNTFFYGPSTNTRNLLSFQDATSQLVLQSATFATTTTGIALLKGTMLIDGISYLTPSSSLLASPITFGNGVQSNNNMTINVLPAAQLIVSAGVVENKNV